MEIIKSLVFCTTIYICWILNVKSETVKVAVLGSTVTLECTIPQKDALVWDRPFQPPEAISIRGALQNNFNTSKYSIVESSSQKQESIIIHSLELPDDGNYRCYDLSNVGLKQDFKVNILVQPNSFNISGPNETVNEGTEQTITCDVNGGKPPPSVNWKFVDYTKKEHSRIGTNQDIPFAHGIVNRRSQLKFNVTRQMYRGTFICDASITYFYDVQHTFNLDMNLAPLKPVIQRFDGLFVDGKLYSMQCDSTGSKPAANITWLMNGKRLQSVRQQVFQDTDGTFVTSGFVTLVLTKHMDGHILSCAASNTVSELTGKHPVMTNVTLQAMYVPQITGDNGTKVVREGENITLRCSIDANPPTNDDDVKWTRDGTIVSGYRFSIENGSSPNLDIISVERIDRGTYLCLGSNRLGVGTGPPLVLDVLYPPECSNNGVQKYAARIGETVEITCYVTSNPSNATMTWQFSKNQAFIQQHIPARVSSDDTVYTSIKLYMGSAAQYTNIDCIASNVIGTSNKPCVFQIVRQGPPEVPSNCTISSMTKTQIQIRCSSGFDGGTDQYFLLQQLDDYSGHTNIQNRSTAVFIVADLDSGVNYTYRVCSASRTYSIPTCSEYVSIKLKLHPPGIVPNKKPIAAASIQSSGPYIAGGVVGFVALCCIVGVIIFFYRRNKKRNRPQRFRYAWASAREKNKVHFQEISHITHESGHSGTRMEDNNHHHTVTNDWGYNKGSDCFINETGGSLPSRQHDELPPELNKLKITKENHSKQNNLRPTSMNIESETGTYPKNSENEITADKNSSYQRLCYSHTDVKHASGSGLDKPLGNPCKRSVSLDFVRSREVGEGETVRIPESLILKPGDLPIHVRQFRVSDEMPNIIREESTVSISSNHGEENVHSDTENENDFSEGTNLDQFDDDGCRIIRHNNSYDKAMFEEEHKSFFVDESDMNFDRESWCYFSDNSKSREVICPSKSSNKEDVEENGDEMPNNFSEIPSNVYKPEHTEPITDLDADTTFNSIESALPQEVKEFLSNALYPEHDDVASDLSEDDHNTDQNKECLHI